MDFRIVLACTLIAGAAIGFVTPGGPFATDAGPVADQPDDLPQLATTQVNSADWADGSILQREADGHFYAHVLIDGQSFRMLVDTGASVVALTGADAEAIGLTWDDAEVRPVAQGASGPVEGVAATLPSGALGDHETSNVQAVIIPEDLGISLLGQSFLGTLGSLRVADNQMILGN